MAERLAMALLVVMVPAPGSVVRHAALPAGAGVRRWEAATLSDGDRLHLGACVVTVRRTGGFSGVVVEGEADLASHLRADEIIALLDGGAVTARASVSAQSDRFVYELSVSGHTVILREDDLTPDQQRLIDLVLGT